MVQTESWYRRMKMLDEGDCIVKQGYLKKIKTMKKKFFVLYRDSRSGPARLEYYDTEKKFREKKSGQTARRAIMLRSCFAISDTCDSRQKHGIALYTKDDCFGVGFGDEQERDDWLAAMHALVGGRRGDSRSPMFEHVWDINVPPKDLGKSFSGPYRLCLTVRHISLVKKASVEPDITFPLEVVRRCGHSGNFFFIEVGRQSSTGEGELWMEAEDALIAQNMHYAILLAMNSNKDYDDLPPRIVPQQTAAIVGGSVPQRSNSHSTDSRQSFVQSRVGGGSTAGYDAASRSGSVRPQRSYTFSEPKRSATSQATSRGLGSLLMSMKQGVSHRPGAAAVSAGGAGGSSMGGGGYLGQDLLDRSGSSFYPRMRSDSISSRATSSSLSIDECDQGLASRSLTPDLQAPSAGLLQPCGGGDMATLATADRRSPNFGGSVLSVHSSRAHHGPAFEYQKTNTSSSASSLSGGSLDDPYLDMTPACAGSAPPSARSGGCPSAAYVAMVPCSSSARGGGASSGGCDSYASVMPAAAAASKHQEGYVEMCPATASLGGDAGRGGSVAVVAARPARPDVVRSYLRDAGGDETAERAPSRRASVSGQLPAAPAAAVPVAAAAAATATSCNPYVEMSCTGSSAGSKLQLPPSPAAVSLSGQGSGTGAASTPRSLPVVAGGTAAAALSADSASSSPRNAFATPWHERASSGGSTASLHDGCTAGSCPARSNPQSPRVVTPDLWSQQPAAAVTTGGASQQLLQQQADLFMEMDFDRPRTASDTFSNRPRTHSFSASASAHRPRSSSHGQSSKHRNGGRGGAAAAAVVTVGAPLLTSPQSVASASSAGSSRESTSSSLLGSSNYLDMAAAYGGRADYMDMAFDDRKSLSKARHQQRLHQHRGVAASGTVPQLAVAVPPCHVGAGVSGRSASSLERLEVSCTGSLRAMAAAAPLSPGDYVGIDFSKGFDQRVDKMATTTDNAAISPILLRSGGGGALPEQRSGGWDMAEPFPELSGSSSGEDVNSCRSTRRQQPALRPSPGSSVSHSRSSSCSLSKASPTSTSASRRALPATAAAAAAAAPGAGGDQQLPSAAASSVGQQQQPTQLVKANARASPPASAQRSSVAADFAMMRGSAQEGVGSVRCLSPADAECYEEMGPGGSSMAGFGLTSAATTVAASYSSSAAPCSGSCCGSSCSTNGSGSQGSAVTLLDGGDSYAAMCPQGRDAGPYAPKKGVSYIRQTSRESSSCVPRPAVCYIRPESQSEEGQEPSHGADEDDGTPAVGEQLAAQPGQTKSGGALPLDDGSRIDGPPEAAGRASMPAHEACTRVEPGQAASGSGAVERCADCAAENDCGVASGSAMASAVSAASAATAAFMVATSTDTSGLADPFALSEHS